ncbi:sigma-54 dependent transcriptional regulator [Planktomarina temperata]|nr:sigma-54 dependent transcriptional regulator [bacterium]MDB2458259.1 sigma-54 dependent transcriptional regulator [Planktomarina temperata]
MTVMFSKLVGSSEAAMRLKKLISLVAPSDSAVIVQGETGVGKELVAESVHEASRRKGKFVSVNCAAIPRDLMEAELFGYEKGAFTGAIKTTPGKFEQANKGTLFLDEIGDMNLDLQSKLLRVLENSIVTRVGGRADIQLDVRVVCATHKDLDELVRQNKFREDLLFRLNVFPIQVPTLRERSDDIPEIVAHFLKQNSSINSTNAPINFDGDGLEALRTYDWPGNIRELRNILERAKVFFPGQNIDRERVTHTLLKFDQNSFFNNVEENETIWGALDDLGGAERGNEADERSPPTPNDFSRIFEIANSVDVRRLLRDIEIVLIEKALERNAGNASEAAKDLHLQRTTLIEKIKKYGIQND